jgi:LacI family transcriptional regulator, galactose operon repressor
LKKARIKDIAARAGVSTGTVDRVLHERGEVAEKTREKIMKIAKDLDYSPNFIARALKTKRKLHLVSLLPEATEENAFWLKHPRGLQKAIDELEPFPVKLSQVTFDLLDERDFQEKTGSVLNLRPDGVILAPIFKAESIDFCSRLTKKNIPFVFLDACVNETEFLSYTGEDIFQSGRVAGQLTDMVTPPGRDVLIINIVRDLKNVHHLNKRTQGFLSYFSQPAGRRGKIFKLVISDPVPEKISRETGKALKKNPSISSIFVTGSRSYRIADYIHSSGKGPLNIIGYDLLEKNVSHLKSGTIKFLIGQRPEEQAYRGIRKLFDFLSLNKVPEKMEYLPIDIVTSENVNFFINNH